MLKIKMKNPMDKKTLESYLREKFAEKIDSAAISVKEDMVTIDVLKQNLLEVCYLLRDDEAFKFDMLLDVCGVDYLDYGCTQWRTTKTTESGFSRGRSEKDIRVIPWNKPRYASVYHLLSIQHNHRLRITVAVDESLIVPSVIDVWNSANWYEREAFDLYGIVYDGHPDLRRLLTDYGFIGHPFRKDFPLIGEVELRYDALQKRCIYEPVSIIPRVLVPKVIRDDNRYVHTELDEKH
jgi:NADH-quinone oxidoreductase subunit C